MDKNYTKKEYAKYVDQKMPKSKLGKNITLAFIIGGLICVLGQGLKTLYMNFGMEELAAGNAVSVTLIFLGALFTGLGIYDKLAKHAGAGTIVPITGFANAIVSPAMEFKKEGIVLGMSAKMFSVAGPVIVFGTVTSVVVGIIYIILGLA